MSPNEPCKKICAWLSRHPPSAAQYRSLQDFRIIQFPNRWKSAKQAWCCVMERCEVEPALAVVVMPQEMLCQFILHAGQTEVIYPKMAYGDRDHWTGKWLRLYVYPKIGFQTWEPEVVERKRK